MLKHKNLGEAHMMEIFAWRMMRLFFVVPGSMIYCMMHVMVGLKVTREFRRVPQNKTLTGVAFT
jgi:hypothetical protein